MTLASWVYDETCDILHMTDAKFIHGSVCRTSIFTLLADNIAMRVNMDDLQNPRVLSSVSHDLGQPSGYCDLPDQKGVCIVLGDTNILALWAAYLSLIHI